MKPALSIILFTTIAGAAQGMVVALALATLAGIAPATALAPMLWAATGMLLVALVASFFHLGHPLRAWRTVLMWRTSWMSREVIVLPAGRCWPHWRSATRWRRTGSPEWRSWAPCSCGTAPR